MPEHRVRLAQRFHDAAQLVAREIPSVRASSLLSSPPCGQELVERRIEQPDRHRQSVHRLEDPLEVRALHRQQLGERAAASALVARHDHLAHRGDAIALEEHVLGATEPDALGAERRARCARRAACRRWRARAGGGRRRPSRAGARTTDTSARSVRSRVPRIDLHDLARRRRQIAAIDACRSRRRR